MFLLTPQTSFPKLSENQILTIRFDLLEFLHYDCFNDPAHYALWMHDYLIAKLKKQENKEESVRGRIPKNMLR